MQKFLDNKMMPNLNSRQVEKMMQKMGVTQTHIDATEVIIRTRDKDIIIKNPQVSKVNMMGQQTFQVSGEITEGRAQITKIEITKEDIQTVMDQTGVNQNKAKEVLEKYHGDLALAILDLQNK